MAKTKPRFKRGSKEHHDFLRAIASSGGNTTKKRKLAEDPEYYAKIGFRGGESLKQSRGLEYYRTLRSKSSAKKWGEEGDQS